MFALLVILIILGIILEVVSLKRDLTRVEIGCAVSATCTEPGATFGVQTIITNNSLLPVSYMEIRKVYPLVMEVPENLTLQRGYDGLHVKFVCRMGGRSRKNLVMETSIRKRGLHSFRGDSVGFGDFLGFREVSNRISIRSEIVVYPEKLENTDLTEVLGRFIGDITARRYLIRDPILTVGSREYTGREPMKEIHWLQSAHRGELMVREFDYNRHLCVCVLMSVEGIDPWKDDELDVCCSAARTICETLVMAGAVVNFFTNARLRMRAGRDIWKCEVSPGNTQCLLEGLGRVSAHMSDPLEKMLVQAIRESDLDAAFIVILPVGDKRGEKAEKLLRGDTGREVLIINKGVTA